jgi:hypothetical protein
MLMTNGTITIECTDLTKNVWEREGFYEVSDEPELTYQEMKSKAKELGINTHGMSKQTLIDTLKAQP